jgi:hypothetical protein
LRVAVRYQKNRSLCSWESGTVGEANHQATEAPFTTSTTNTTNAGGGGGGMYTTSDGATSSRLLAATTAVEISFPRPPSFGLAANPRQQRPSYISSS